MHGLKQVSHDWFDCLSQFLLQLNFYCSKVDSSLFIYRTHDITIVLLIYVADVLITRNNNQFIISLLEKFNHEFAIKDLDSLHYFLGVEFKYFDEKVFLSQHKCKHDLLSRTKILDSNPTTTPQVLAHKPSHSNKVLIDAITFQNIVEALQYLDFIGKILFTQLIGYVNLLITLL